MNKPKAELDVNEEVSLNLLRMQLINERKSRHLSQQDIADATGLSVPCVRNVENTAKDEFPNLRSMMKYVNAMGLELFIRPIERPNETPLPPVESAKVVQAKPVVLKNKEESK